ncbi:substrate-binding domain-containing protein [uncultured Eudoraea sp.]|uniref:substrate-binding domain-containing protein n=1 Tax=uncultured Eudoraea sp. TaxID=1035614 RepID=UPI00263462E4|nr:substrate-binding domain-containing protein [uncultured Eudoraea sp.]
MKTVKIIGVPEHFNYAWLMAIEEGAFETRGINLIWTDVPEGTGKMCAMLEEGQTDLAIILTEGIVKSITEGNPVKIVQEYIATPLQWGIHVAADSEFQNMADLQNATVAISRFGSGSHLMSFVNAQSNGWDTSSLNFHIVNTLDGAIDALKLGTADYFMWEHFTTKPIVDSGIFRRLADCPTPWPCFVIAATESFLNKNREILQHILEVINLYTTEFKRIPSIDRTISNKYEQRIEDVREWLGLTEWSQSQISLETINIVQDYLFKLKLIKNKLDIDELITSL